MSIQPGLKSETWSFAREFSVYFFIHLFLHNVCVLKSNLSDSILYLMTFTFKLLKHKMATKMLRKAHIFYVLSQTKAQFMVFASFLISNLFPVTLERKYLYLTFKSKTLNPYYYYKYTAKHVDDNMTHC